jgi:plastocyanin
MHLRTRVAVLACLAVFALVALAGCYGSSSTPATGGTSGGAAGGSSVTISSFTFSPANLEVKVGTSVTWTNQDTPAHRVVADDGSFQSADLATGQSFSHAFDKAGTYKYHCNIHPQMVGQIVVK